MKEEKCYPIEDEEMDHPEENENNLPEISFHEYLMKDAKKQSVEQIPKESVKKRERKTGLSKTIVSKMGENLQKFI